MDGHWGGPCEGAYDPQLPEVCDEGKLDENCDGSVNPGCECYDGQVPRPCPNGTDAGECSAGTQSCSGGRWSACAGSRGPVAETCNGKDDDCDGTMDNSPTDCKSPLTCRAGRCDECADGDVDAQTCAGTDTGECTKPQRTCSAGRWGQCAGGKGQTSETCDGLDNDCDNTTDEDATCSGNQMCMSGRCVSSCPNAVVDADEQCDPDVQEWRGACNADCTRRYFVSCSTVGESCSYQQACAEFTYSTGGNTGRVCSQSCSTDSDCNVMPNQEERCNFVSCVLLCAGTQCPKGMHCVGDVILADYNGAAVGTTSICVPD
jgi:hypothetical protein